MKLTRISGTLRQKIHRMKGNPRQLARSFALGSFIGVSPMIGMQVLISLGLSFLFRLNKTAAVAGVLNTNWTKGLFLYPINYQIGAWLLGIDTKVDIAGIFAGNVLKNLAGAGTRLFIPLLLGGCITGLLLAVFYYHLILRITGYKARTTLSNTSHKPDLPTKNTIKMIPQKNQYALITGASKGLGKAFATELASRGIPLMLVALEPYELQHLAAELSGQYGIDARWLAADFRDPDSVYHVAGWATAQAPVFLLINNAGLGGTRAFETASPDYMDTIIQVNIRATTLLTRLMLPVLKQQEKAYILNVASMASFSPFAFKTVYPASKAFVYSFSRGLHEELKHSNVFVSVIHPGPVKTNAEVTARIELQGWKGKMGLVPAEKIARIAIRQVFRRDSLILPGFLNKLNWLMMAILPNAWKLPLLSRAVKRELVISPETNPTIKLVS